jgi:hypothetical protein
MRRIALVLVLLFVLALAAQTSAVLAAPRWERADAAPRWERADAAPRWESVDAPRWE